MAAGTPDPAQSPFPEERSAGSAILLEAARLFSPSFSEEATHERSGGLASRRPSRERVKGRREGNSLLLLPAPASQQRQKWGPGLADRTATQLYIRDI